MQEKQSLTQLRKRWAQAWGMTPHKGIGRAMLEKALGLKSAPYCRPINKRGWINWSGSTNVTPAVLMKNARR